MHITPSPAAEAPSSLASITLATALVGGVDHGPGP